MFRCGEWNYYWSCVDYPDCYHDQLQDQHYAVYFSDDNGDHDDKDFKCCDDYEPEFDWWCNDFRHNDDEELDHNCCSCDYDYWGIYRLLGYKVRAVWWIRVYWMYYLRCKFSFSILYS